jgi:hypothetical protein
MMFFFAIIMAMDKIHKQHAKCSKEELENAELAIKNL